MAETAMVTAASQPYTKDNLVRELTKLGKSWRGYFQSMPYQGYMGYAVRRVCPAA